MLQKYTGKDVDASIALDPTSIIEGQSHDQHFLITRRKS